MQMDALNFEWLQQLPWLRHVVFGNALYLYIIAVINFVIFWAILRFIQRSFIDRLIASPRLASHQNGRFLIGLLREVKGGVLLVLAAFWATRHLDFAPKLERALDVLVLCVVTLQVLVLLSRASTSFIDRIWAGAGDDLSLKNTRRNLAIAVKTVLWGAGFLFLLDSMGINVSTFVTGLGIGGIAIALAAQTILGDTFNSVTIALDKPFAVGDFISIDNHSGVVEHIGLKSTRVRSIGGEILVFCNSDMTKSRIANFKQMQTRRVLFRIGVTYETPPGTVKRIPAIIRTAIETTAQTQCDRVHFAEFGDSALLFEAVYFVVNPDFTNRMDIQQDINFKIMDAFAAEGIDMAYPTRTVHLVSTPTKA